MHKGEDLLAQLGLTKTEQPWIFEIVEGQSFWDAQDMQSFINLNAVNQMKKLSAIAKAKRRS